LDGLERLGDTERQIRHKRLAIEMGCLQLIANEHPQGSDLRHAVAMVEIACELERVGEHAKRVARANCLTIDHRLRKPVANIHRQGAGVQAMLNRVLVAFAGRDVAVIQVILADAQAVDAQYRAVYQELLAVMKNHPRAASQAVYVSRAAYNLKRAAERVSGICDWVLFSVVGSMEGAQPELSHQASHTDLAEQPALVL
jgi:phosphate transport system protein